MDLSGVGFFARVSVYTPLPLSRGELDVLGERKNRHASRNLNSPLEGQGGVLEPCAAKKLTPERGDGLGA